MSTKLQKNIQQYIELVYSQKSPLIQVSSLDERKKLACKQLKIDPADPDVKKIIDLQDEKSRDSIIEFCCKNESNELLNLMSDQHLFLDIQYLKLTPLQIVEDEEKMLKAMNLKTTMSMKAEELLSRMNLSYIKIFKGDAEIKEAKKKINWLSFEQRIKRRDEQREKEKKETPQPA
jgi:hypothetical protein